MSSHKSIGIVAKAKKSTNSVVENHLESRSSTQIFSGYGQADLNNIGIAHFNLRNYSELLSISGFETLTKMYLQNGICRRFIDILVDDALKGGIHIEGENIDDDMAMMILEEIERLKLVDIVSEAKKMSRLYGGSVIVTESSDDNSSELINVNELKKLHVFSKGDLLGFSANEGDTNIGCYNIDGNFVHKSRVFRVVNGVRTSEIRKIFGLWGYSEIDLVFRELNLFYEIDNVLNELVSESKINVYSVKGFNDLMLNPIARERLENSIKHTNTMKNVYNAIIKDADMDFTTTQVSFGDFPGLYAEYRRKLCAAAGYPETRLFGVQTAGFSSGEGELEVYNERVEVTRYELDKIFKPFIGAIIESLFGKRLQFKVKYQPMRVMSRKEEEEIKSSIFNRWSSAVASGIFTVEEARQGIENETKQEGF